MVVGEHVEALQLNGRQATQGAPLADGVLGPGRRLSALSSDDGPGWTVQRIRKGQRSLTEDVRVASAALAGLPLGTLQVLPFGQVVLIDPVFLRHLTQRL